MADSKDIRQLAEDNLAYVLERAKANEGRIHTEDATAAQLFCRVVEAETNGGAYGVTTYLNGENRDRILAGAARAAGSGGGA